jgi:hypothetical protein
MQALDLFLSSMTSPETRNGYNTFILKNLDLVQTDNIFYGNKPSRVKNCRIFDRNENYRESQ